MTQEIVKVLQDKAQNLTGERRKKSKTVPNELVDADTIKDRFKTLASHPGLHSASVPGILALDINANNTSHILTGGADKTATIFNKDDEQVSHMQGSIMGAFNNHVDRFFAFFDHPPTTCRHFIY